MATETVPASAPSDIAAAADALLETLRYIDGASAIVAKLEQEVEAVPGYAGGLTISLGILLGQMHSIVSPAHAAAFDATLEAKHRGSGEGVAAS